VTLYVDGKTRNKSTLEIKDCDKVNYLEHVQVHVTLSATKRGDVQINLISPSGTKSTLIDKRIKDYSRSGFNDWPFLSVNLERQSLIYLKFGHQIEN
jgi:subtilisin-like proprotein convertase family protein